MTKPAAKKNDLVVGLDTHVVLVASPGGPTPTPTPLPFVGQLVGELSADVIIQHLPAATVHSVATNSPPHIAVGGTFQREPSNEGRVVSGSGTVFINKLPAARLGDDVETCNDPKPATRGVVLCSGTVFAGD